MKYNNMTMVPTDLTEDEILDNGLFLGFNEEPAIVHRGVAYHGAIYEYGFRKYIILPRPSDKWMRKKNNYLVALSNWVAILSDDELVEYEKCLIQVPLEIEQIKPIEDDWDIETDVYEVMENE